MLSLQKEQKQKQNLLDSLLKIKDDIELIDYTLQELMEENSFIENKDMISEMSDLANIIQKKINYLETTKMFKEKE